MKTQRRIIAAILSVMIILTALPLVTFAQALEYLDASVQKSAGADEKPQKLIRRKLRAVHGNGSGEISEGLLNINRP